MIEPAAQAIRAALVDARFADAVTLAEQAAAADAMSPLVAAVLVLHAPAGAAHRDAVARLGRASAIADELVHGRSALVAALREDPDDPARWIRLLQSLAVARRVAEVLEGLRLAHARAMPALLWQASAMAAAMIGAHDLARAILEDGVARHPEAADLWGAAAMARLAGGDRPGARRAADRALAVDDNVAASWLAAAQVAIAELDHPRAQEAIRNARLLLVPEEILRALADAAARLP